LSSRILVTGANGFVGQVLCGVLGAAGYSVRAALRGPCALPVGATDSTLVGDIDATTDWSAALAGVDLVAHLAGRAHRLGDTRADAERYAATNAWGTRRLAEACAAAGVRRLVFVSTVKVNGEGPTITPYSAQDPPAPHDPYGQSKWLGEQLLQEVTARSHLQAAIVRPPLVYGPGVRANFLRLLRWVDRGWPIPLGAVQNRRSLVSVWNLCDLLMRLLTHPGAAGRVWMVSDDEDLSTPELMREIARAMERRARLIPVPVALLASVAAATGRRAELRRLCGSLQVDITPTRHELAWAPPVSFGEGLARTVSWYRSQTR
jgi:nucleoside-diphosphate-sugar epimerase